MLLVTEIVELTPQAKADFYRRHQQECSVGPRGGCGGMSIAVNSLRL